jgi:UDP-2,3-diacylglucosamine pyrophosphatase LpxH
LIVSDLHFGEELLPGASTERREAVELGAQAFCEFLRYEAARRLGGRPWRLVIAGDLFDFMSVVIPGSPEQPARNADERRLGVGRGAKAGVKRLDAICMQHTPLITELARFANAHHAIDIIVGNHDVELLEPEVVAALERHLVRCGATADAMTRIRVVPWFIYLPGVAWIEHGHVYDEGCSFEFNLAPIDPKDDRLVFNADYAAIRYLGMASPEIDPHGIEEWSFGGFLQYAWGRGFRSFLLLMGAYIRFMWALLGAGMMHRSLAARRRRRTIHRERLEREAKAGGISLETAEAIDRLARAPLTVSWRRLGRLLVLEKWAVIGGSALVSFVLWLALPFTWAVIFSALAVFGGVMLLRGLGKHLVTSQLPMRAVPRRLRSLVDAPIVVFGHTHDPRWQPILGGGVYVNAGTWLPAIRPGLRRSFTHVLIQPLKDRPPVVELRQWRDGTSLPFDAKADLGAGVTNPNMARVS